MMRIARLAGFALAIAVAWVLLMPRRPLAQPGLFAHVKHAGLDCTVCHRGVETGARAGLPESALCLKCHATAPAGGPSAIWEDAGRSRHVNWVRVTSVPDHVLFSHRRHVALGRLDCVSCHADVGRRAEPPSRAPLRLDMQACLACHAQESASQDCAACHR